MMRVVVTGAGGLIGSEASSSWLKRGARVWGVDNNERMKLFGPTGNTSHVIKALSAHSTFRHVNMDIRDRNACLKLIDEVKPDIVIHCAAQPSHDKAASIPFADFDINAVGTFNMLEAVRQSAPGATFIHMSTNKVYGDAPNFLPMISNEMRYDLEPGSKYENGINEELTIDNSKHSLFGASKLAADIVAQEYGKYFGMNVCVFRGGCLTGPQHTGVELHGFLSYIIKSYVKGNTYTVFGYDGKQVRDQIHTADVISAMDAYIEAPRPGEVYNLGGGKENSMSILEVIDTLNESGDDTLYWEYDKTNRIGDHICYYTDMSKFKSHFPNWKIKHNIRSTITEMLECERGRS